MADPKSSPRSSVPRVNDVVSGSASSIASKRSYQFAHEHRKKDLAGLGRPKMVSTADVISTSAPDQLTGNPLHYETSRASPQLPRNGQRPLKPNVPRRIIGTESSPPFPLFGVSCPETLRPLFDRSSPHKKPSAPDSGVREPIIPSTSHRMINPTQLFPVMLVISPFQIFEVYMSCKFLCGIDKQIIYKGELRHFSRYCRPAAPQICRRPLQIQSHSRQV